MKGEKLDYSRWNLVSLKCGYLITVDDYHEPCQISDELVPSNIILAKGYTFFGSVIGVEYKDRFIDIFDSKDFRIIRRERDGQLDTTGVQPGELRVLTTSLEVYKFSDLPSMITLDQLRDADFANIKARMKELGIPHISEPECREILEARYPKKFPKKSKLVRNLERIKKELVGYGFRLQPEEEKPLVKTFNQ
ncbi:MAG: hypothetical protein ACOXZS_04240 [Bacilli bacterium]